METLRKNSTVLMVVTVVLIALIGFGIRSEGRLSALEADAETMEYKLASIDNLQEKINNMNIKLTQVERDIDWIKQNATEQTNKINQILKELKSQ